MEPGTSFTLSISGDPKVNGDEEKLVKAVSRSALRVDPDHELEYTHFAKISYRFVWSGVVKDMNKVDDLHKLAMKKMKEYLSKWEYSIKVDYVERGDG